MRHLLAGPFRPHDCPTQTCNCPVQNSRLPHADLATASCKLEDSLSRALVLSWDQWSLEISLLCLPDLSKVLEREREKYSKDTPQLMLTMTHHCLVLSLPLHMVVFREDREPHSGLYPLTMHQRFPSLHGLGTSSESAKMIITPECNRGISWRITSIHRLETYSVSPKRIITPDTNGGRTWRVPSLCHLRTPSVSPNRL